MKKQILQLRLQGANLKFETLLVIANKIGMNGTSALHADNLTLREYADFKNFNDFKIVDIGRIETVTI